MPPDRQHRVSRPRIRTRLRIAAAILPLGVAAAAPWTHYRVYRPSITRSTVIDGDHAALHYNHCAALAHFKHRWVCLWNANTQPIEGRPGQRIYMSLSTDGLSWSPPEAAFDNPRRSLNPVPCPRGVQWQPNLIVAGGELWAFWSQWTKPRNAYYGCWFSRLRQPDGRWRNRRLTWNGSPDPKIAGCPRRVLPLSAPARLASGRILVPVTLLGPRAAAAPPRLHGWAALEKRDSVLWSDDLGKTWHVSPGAVQPARPWAQWEPAVWEPRPGQVRMFARNNAPVPPTQALLYSTSRDAGETWSPHIPVPIPTAAARMQVVVLGDSDRCMMAHNDWMGSDRAGRRYNLALFFTRGDGPDFVAGPGFSGFDPNAAYPAIALSSGKALAAYSAGAPPRTIRIACIQPLPAPKTHYLFPRTNLPPPPAPHRSGDFLRFAGGQYLTSRRPPPLRNPGFRVFARLLGADGVLLDCRRSRPARGFVIALKHDHPAISMPMAEHEIISHLALDWYVWNTLSITVNLPRRRIVFQVNQHRELRRFTPGPHPDRILEAGTVRIGGKRLESSRLPGFRGALQTVALFPESEPEAPSTAALMRLDPADPASLEAQFVIPAWRPVYPELRTERGIRILRLPVPASAGVDVAANRRQAGDAVRLRFRFRVQGAGPCTVCTAGDAGAPARVVVDSRGRVDLAAPGVRRPLGRLLPGAWTWLTLRSAGRQTSARLDNGPETIALHAPRFTVLYLGEGYPNAAAWTPVRRAQARLDIDVQSLVTQVRRRP